MIYIGAIIIIVVQNPQPEDTSEVPYEPSEATMQTTGAIASPPWTWTGALKAAAWGNRPTGGQTRSPKGGPTRNAPFPNLLSPSGGGLSDRPITPSPNF